MGLVLNARSDSFNKTKYEKLFFSWHPFRKFLVKLRKKIKMTWKSFPKYLSFAVDINPPLMDKINTRNHKWCEQLGCSPDWEFVINYVCLPVHRTFMYVYGKQSSSMQNLAFIIIIIGLWYDPFSKSHVSPSSSHKKKSIHHCTDTLSYYWFYDDLGV